MADITPSILLFVINPISGGKHKNDYEADIKKHFLLSPHTVNFHLLKGENDAEELKKCIENIKPQIVVAVGGDGTVSMVAKKLLGTDIKLGILPAGSANGMARELNIPINITESLLIIEKGIARKADVICINEEVCLHLSDIGLNAQLVKYFQEGKMRGKLGYAKVVLKVLFRQRNMRVIIETNDKQIKRDAFMVVLANASKYGTGVIINPKGSLYDGLFEIIIVRKLGIVTLIKMWFNAKELDPKKIEVIQATSVHIQTYRKVHFQVDGEYRGRIKIINAEILPAQLNIILNE